MGAKARYCQNGPDYDRSKIIMPEKSAFFGPIAIDTTSDGHYNNICECKAEIFTLLCERGGAVMGKNLDLSIWFDFYGDMLTDKQREAVELYYNEDLSLAEIASHMDITRQGVRDSIKRGEATLVEMEEKLGLAERFSRIQAGLDSIIEHARSIELEADRVGFNGAIMDKTRHIIQIAGSLNDE